MPDPNIPEEPTGQGEQPEGPKLGGEPERHTTSPATGRHDIPRHPTQGPLEPHHEPHDETITYDAETMEDFETIVEQQFNARYTDRQRAVLEQENFAEDVKEGIRRELLPTQYTREEVSKFHEDLMERLTANEMFMAESRMAVEEKAKALDAIRKSKQKDEGTAEADESEAEREKPPRGEESEEDRLKRIAAEKAAWEKERGDLLKAAEVAAAEAIKNPLDVQAQQKADEALRHYIAHHDKDDKKHGSESLEKKPWWAHLSDYGGIAIMLLIYSQYAAATMAQAVSGDKK